MSCENKNLYLLKKSMCVFAFEKKYFDSLALRPLELYVNLVGHFVAYYSQPFNLPATLLKNVAGNMLPIVALV
jgi:hypothetical protein